MRDLSWEFSVLVSRWRNRFRYVLAAPSTYRNWWAMILPKLGISVVLELRNGLRYLVRAGGTDLAVVNEAAMANPYLGTGHITVAEDAVVLDVGANVGDFAMQIARICRKGRVIAVEPVSDYTRIIAVQSLLNGFDNVTCVQAALSDHEGTMKIHVEGAHSSLYWGDNGGKTEMVRLMTLSQLMEEHGISHIDVLKLDCEGAEWDILPDAEALLPKIRQICMEFHCGRGWTGISLAAWLRERGYEVWHTSGPWNGMLWATRGNPEKMALATQEAYESVDRPA